MNKISTLTSQWTAKWDNTESKGSILAFDEIFNAPQQAGIYAWYAVLGLGEMDISCESQTRTALRKQTKKYTPSPPSDRLPLPHVLIHLQSYKFKLLSNTVKTSHNRRFNHHTKIGSLD